MKINNKIKLIAGLLLAGLITVLVGCDNKMGDKGVAIGVVDMMQVAQQSASVKQLQTQFNQENQGEQAKLQGLYQTINKLQAEAAKSKTPATEEKVKEAQKTFNDSLQAFNAKQQKQAEQVEAKLQDTLAKIAKDKGLTVIFYKQVVGYRADNVVDVTADVIKQLS